MTNLKNSTKRVEAIYNPVTDCVVAHCPLHPEEWLYNNFNDTWGLCKKCRKTYEFDIIDEKVITKLRKRQFEIIKELYVKK